MATSRETPASPMETPIPGAVMSPLDKPVPVERSAAEKALVHQLEKFRGRLNWGASLLQLLTVLIAMGAIVLSLLVAAYTGYEGKGAIGAGQLKLLAFLSAVCTAIYTGFRLRSKAADLRSAFRLLTTELMRYQIGAITAEQLIDTYSKAETMIGQVEVDGLGDRQGPPPTTASGSSREEVEPPASPPK